MRTRTSQAPACHSSHFCYASESCVPIVPLETALAEIGISVPGAAHTAAEAGAGAGAGAGASAPLPRPVRQQSWLNYSPKANNGYAHQLQWTPLLGVVPDACLLKSDQWALLSRHHALRVLQLPGRLASASPAAAASTATAVSHGGADPGTAVRSSSSQLQQQHQQQAAYDAAARSRSAILQLFKNVRASDEMFFPCCLAI